jgi:homoserine kinase type II
MAVYTEVSDDQLNDFLEGFNLGAPLSFKGIAEGVENTNFLLVTEKGRFILTLYEKRVNKEDLPFFLDLIEHLSNGGIICPTPLHDNEGKTLKNCAGRPAALFTFLDGMSVKRPTAHHCGALGAALGEFHQCGLSFKGQRENSFSISGLKDFYNNIDGNISSIEPDLAAIIEDEIAYLSNSWPAGLPTGVIHADLFPDNVFFLGDEVSGLIDFYFACIDFLSLDLAITINAWCFEQDHSFNVTKAGRFLSAYHQIRPIDPEEIETLPIIARAAALRFLLTRTHDWLVPSDGALVAKKDPREYLRKLKFHQSISNPASYGFTAPV